MSKLVYITQLLEITGLSVSTIRRRISNHNLPYTRANSQTGGKLLFDAELIMQLLKQEIYSNFCNYNMDGDTQEAESQNTSYLANLLKPPADPVEAAAERDKNFGYPVNTNISGSFAK